MQTKPKKIRFSTPSDHRTYFLVFTEMLSADDSANHDDDDDDDDDGDDGDDEENKDNGTCTTYTELNTTCTTLFIVATCYVCMYLCLCILCMSIEHGLYVWSSIQTVCAYIFEYNYLEININVVIRVNPP